MKESYDNRVREGWPMEIGELIVKRKDDVSVAGQVISKTFNQMLCYLEIYILGHSK